MSIPLRFTPSINQRFTGGGFNEDITSFCTESFRFFPKLIILAKNLNFTPEITGFQVFQAFWGNNNNLDTRVKKRIEQPHRSICATARDRTTLSRVVPKAIGRSWLIAEGAVSL